MAVVLCISTVEALATTRRMILEQAGHRVVTAYTIHDVEQACDQQEFDVAVVGQGIPHRERLRVFDLVRTQCRSAKILELYPPSLGRSLTDADDWLAVPADAPAELAERVSALAALKRRKRRGTTGAP